MEILVAALLPPLIVAALAQRCDGETRRAFRLFALLTTIWLLPCWATLSTNAPFDYLLDEPPWRAPQGPGRLTKNFLLNDVVTQIIPMREAARRSMAAGFTPFLDRYAGGGMPLWENPQLALLYPVNIAGLPFSSFAWPLFSSSMKLLIAACGMFLFLRRIGASYDGSVFGAIGWAFCTFQIAFLLFPVTNVTVLLPLALLALDRLIEKDRPSSVAAVVAVWWMMLAGGHPESVLHCAIVAAAWIAVRLHRKSNRAADLAKHCAAIAGALLLAAALAAPLLVPFALYAPYSERVAAIRQSRDILRTAPFEASTLIPSVIPNYFGNPRVHNYRHPVNFNELCTQYAGLTALILAIGAVRRRHWLWIALFVIALLLAISPAPVAALVAHIPLLDIAANGRMRFVMAFCVLVLAALGFQERPRAIAAIAFVTVSLIAILSYPTLAHYGVRRLVFFTELFALAGAAAIFFGRTRALHWLLFLDLASVMLFYNPANPRTTHYPMTPALAAMQRGAPPYRVTGIGRSLLPNIATAYGLEDIRPHDPLAFAPYVETLVAAGFDRTDYFGRFLTAPPDALLRFLGVQFVLDGNAVRRLPPSPRYFSDGAKVELLRYTPNGAVLRVRASAPAVVQSSEVALPGWRIEKDGAPWTPSTTSGAFLAWQAPAGVSTFTLDYLPVGLADGSAIAAAGALVMAIWMMVLRRKATP